MNQTKEGGMKEGQKETSLPFFSAHCAGAGWEPGRFDCS